MNPEQREIFLNALREFPQVLQAAQKARIPITSLYKHRKRDETFAAAWDDALRDGKLRPQADDPARRPRRKARITPQQVEIFLNALREKPDFTRACRMAKVSTKGMSRRRTTDPQFAQQWDDALQQAHLRLQTHILAVRALEAEREAEIENKITADQIEIFLNALRENPNVKQAALKAGILKGNLHERRAYYPDFAAAWDDALLEGLLREKANKEASHFEDERTSPQGRRASSNRTPEIKWKVHVILPHDPSTWLEPVEDSDTHINVQLQWPKD